MEIEYLSYIDRVTITNYMKRLPPGSDALKHFTNLIDVIDEMESSLLRMMNQTHRAYRENWSRNRLVSEITGDYSATSKTTEEMDRKFVESLVKDHEFELQTDMPARDAYAKGAMDMFRKINS